jgi:hypothetical protein
MAIAIKKGRRPSRGPEFAKGITLLILSQHKNLWIGHRGQALETG